MEIYNVLKNSKCSFLINNVIEQLANPITYLGDKKIMCTEALVA
jgi:hypothetical protein